MVVEDLTFIYPGAVVPALNGVSLKVPPGSALLLHGETGSGKSTLLGCLSGACPAFSGGTITGRVEIGGRSPQAMTPAERVRRIGVVYQDPEAQQVHSTVAREVAFTLENLGVPPREMEWRVAEALAMVGLSDRAEDAVASLSGGLRQRVALAAALVHQPAVLLLDEPASQIDPVAAEELWDVLRRLRDDFSITLILSEHRIDRLYGWVDQVAVMEAGRVAATGSPREVAAWLCRTSPAQAPVLARLRSRPGAPDHPEEDMAPALTVREVRQRIGPAAGTPPPGSDGPGGQSGAPPNRLIAPATAPSVRSGPLARGPATPDILVGLDRATVVYSGGVRALDECTAALVRGRVTAIIGPNGAGKSTLLRALAGAVPLSGGRVTGARGHVGPVGPGEPGVPAGPGAVRIAFLPQNPNDLLSQETVAEELGLALRLQGVDRRRVEQAVAQAAEAFGITEWLGRHPRDLSGGERTRVALAALSAAAPDLFLLDEPTRGLDPLQKQSLGRWLRASGRTAAVATHDLDFVAEFADAILFLDRGRVALAGTPAEVFGQALWFAPVVARALRGAAPGVLCLADAVAAGWAR
ncbi:ABC transporter ATP-binding protein [Alicyclobacillus sp.]|uniref:ABC transporter ATP-binding protein n=1 Tax=Alicyclobacillus sp. TaxID=61169 RepID=UPI0025BD9F93|nr:ATP-binding cassette domain-containing protein [Alicyclobacillus sp.]